MNASRYSESLLLIFLLAAGCGDRTEDRSQTTAATAAQASAENQPLPDWVTHYHKLLDKKVAFEFVETPLSEGLEFIQTLTGAGIILDPRAFEAGGDREMPITLKVSNMRLSNAMKWILRLAELDCVLKDEVIFISTPQRIMDTRGEDTEIWTAYGHLLPEKPVFETDHKHYPISPPCDPGDDDWKRAIHRKLQRKVSFEFVDTPLIEAIYFFQTLTKINMILDPRADSGEVPVNMKVQNISLQAALKKVLAAAGLDYTVEDEALFISLPRK